MRPDETELLPFCSVVEELGLVLLPDSIDSALVFTQFKYGHLAKQAGLVPAAVHEWVDFFHFAGVDIDEVESAVGVEGTEVEGSA